MSDFSARFGRLFERYVLWIESGRVSVARVEGRYPIDDATGNVSISPRLDEHESWSKGKYTVVTIFYGHDYPESERILGFGGRISRECAAILTGIGLAKIKHNVFVGKDKWVVWIEETAGNYRRLPPAD